MNTARKLSATSIASLAFAVLALAAPLAHAETHGSTVTGPKGQSASRNVNRTAGEVQAGTTGPNGQSTQRNVSRSATGAQGSVTGPAGGTSTRNTTRDASGSSTTATGPQGQSGTVTVQRQN